MLQIILCFLLFVILIIPTGKYLYKVSEGKETFADPVFNRIENLLYKICRIDRHNIMGWKEYAVTLLITNSTMILIGYTVLRIQQLLFFNPNDINAMEASLAFNTIISFMTNTNLQHYSGESALSYLSQMLVITMMMVTSAATGCSAFLAMGRGFCGKPFGNYFVDAVRVTTRVLIPLSVIVGLLLVTQGVPQTLSPNITLTTIEGKLQDIPMGPVASLESIKHLGTNGGGFLGANSSTPIENPTIISNLLEMYSMMLLPGACVITFGLMCYYSRLERKNLSDKKSIVPWIASEGKSIFIAMSLIFLIGVSVCFYSESAGNPILTDLGVTQSMGSMEGKEVRFGIAQSALFTTVTTAFTTGTVNNMHDTLTPLGGMIPLLNMMMNAVFGGIGVGLMNMLVYVLLSVFICGLMIGRTPEYLGKKIESREVKLAVLVLVLHPLLILSFSALAVSTQIGLEGITNPGFHGLSQVLYEFSSAAANNGSGFEGMADNTLFWNISTGVVMFLNRYLPIVLQLAIAGALLSKRYINESSGTLQTANVQFGVILAAIVLIFSALTFLPAISLGPIAEHLILWRY